MRLPRSLTLLAATTPFVLAAPKVTVPAAGGTLAAGKVSVTFEDDGTSPAISELSTYTVQLMVGGNADDNSLPLTTIVTNGEWSSSLTASGTITAGLAGNTANGFYFKITSVATAGGTYISYSNRFTMSGMTGTTPAEYTTAVTALNGATAGPTPINQIAAAAQTAAAMTGDPYTIPYYLQTGPVKYAPMQPVPPTAITAKTYSPLYPTSSYSLATTYLPLPSITTTQTQAQTFSVSSIENTIAAQAAPTADGSDNAGGTDGSSKKKKRAADSRVEPDEKKRHLANFLARWKD
ncbi:hypothetical protein EJ03DRAFT_370451 [Teratosphaeria nubilosa]|uniref:Uncharacterized protein n=1 Tax=Teratosphaeria nubilosa TaxID=161662 RepID=A0A6G1LNH5_9PEZI|nr:hypothetical protein EJ03DRAFT_370451 [Teratosphaeria nubilosa]